MRGVSQEPVAERLDRLSIPEPNTGCVLWLGLCNSLGYAMIGVFKDGSWTIQRAHRVAYEMAVGPIPKGLEPDHLCRVRCCINPRHIEPVTHRENMLRGATISSRNARKTHCPRKHEYSPGNTLITPRGTRVCRTCKRELEQERRQGLR